MGDEAETVISATGLSRSFGGVKAVADVSFAVKKGEIFGVIGPNGAGKTSLFNLLSGVVRPSEGQIEVFGRKAERLPAYRRAGIGIGRTFQTSQAFGTLTVLENFAAARTGLEHGLRGWFRKASSSDKVTADRAQVEMWGLGDQATRNANELSLFDQQRLAIALAVVSGGRILLLDEPSGGLVESDVKQLLDLIRGLRDRGFTVLVIDHKMRLMMQLCDRIMVMASGREIMTGSPAEVGKDARVHELYFGKQRRGLDPQI